MSRPTGHPGYSETYLCEETSAHTARRLVRTALAVWHLDAYIDTGALLVSELVANAVRHTDSRLIRVVVWRLAADRVRIGVTDKSRVMPTVKRQSGGLSVDGRGLLLIEALTERWGTDQYGWGKHVWAELKIEDRT
ncbi:ATP-binding protein [Streptomyces griseoaurantiacus]|uniref:ATP-binding protein n=1 Tax=Streptomyces griseoaurantiacus TaxID=68213 RepID=UPI002867D282|nr:ATP-binding protein [Streptomyces griseoaurantiacus]